MRWERARAQPPALQQQDQVGVCEASSGPGKRWGHSCNAIKGGRFLYVFGGYGNCQTNQVHVFDTANQTWTQPAIKGTPPTPRDSHSCTAVGDNLYVFGGTDGMNPLKDLYILDTSSHTWVCPCVRGEGPEAREGHSAALVGKRLFVFGGCGKSFNNIDEVYYNDLYILNTETFVWKRATTIGNPPSARDSHTCSSWKNKIIVIGGEDGHDYYLSDVHILDADTLVWIELNATGQMLPPRAGHSTVALGKNLFVFGGFTDAQNLYDDLYMLDIDTGVWTRVMTTGDGPSARFSIAGDSLDPLRSGVLVFVGGCNKSLEALDDMYFLYTGLVVRDDGKLEKLSLKKQLKLKCQEQNLANPLHDRALVSAEVSTEMNQPLALSSYGRPLREDSSINQAELQGKKTFQAKVTECLPHGYNMETIIDGKPLRGILFSNRPTFVQTATHNPTRKRVSGEVGSTILNGDCTTKLKTSGIFGQDAADYEQSYTVCSKEPTSHEIEVTAQSLKDASLHKEQDPVNCKPLAASLNLTYDKTDDRRPTAVELNNS